MKKATIKDLINADINQMAQYLYTICLMTREKCGINTKPTQTDCQRLKCKFTCPLAPKKAEEQV